MYDEKVQDRVKFALDFFNIYPNSHLGCLRLRIRTFWPTFWCQKMSLFGIHSKQIKYNVYFLHFFIYNIHFEKENQTKKSFKKQPKIFSKLKILFLRFKMKTTLRFTALKIFFFIIEKEIVIISVCERWEYRWIGDKSLMPMDSASAFFPNWPAVEQELPPSFHFHVAWPNSLLQHKDWKKSENTSAEIILNWDAFFI